MNKICCIVFLALILLGCGKKTPEKDIMQQPIAIDASKIYSGDTIGNEIFKTLDGLTVGDLVEIESLLFDSTISIGQIHTGLIKGDSLKMVYSSDIQKFY